jgi:hypothetical protein
MILKAVLDLDKDSFQWGRVVNLVFTDLISIFSYSEGFEEEVFIRIEFLNDS